MSKFQVLDNKRYPIIPDIKYKTDGLPYYRFEHIITLGLSFRKFLVYLDRLTDGGRIHIEEVTTGNATEVKEDTLWDDLYYYLKSEGHLIVQAPLMKATYIL